MNVRHPVLALILATGILALAGCDLIGSDPGTFDVTVEGAAEQAFSGEPVTIINPFASAQRGEKTYNFRLAASRQNVSVTVATDGGRLVRGDYPVGRAGLDLAPARAEAIVLLGNGDAFVSRAGTVTLTEVTADRARGSFELTAIGDGSKVAVKGSFDADLRANAIVGD